MDFSLEITVDAAALVAQLAARPDVVDDDDETCRRDRPLPLQLGSARRNRGIATGDVANKIQSYCGL